MSSEETLSDEPQNEAAPVAEAVGPPPAQVLRPITPAIRRRLQMCYDHATKLMQTDKYDYGYAGTLLSQCVTGDPANLVYWEAFFTNAIRQHKDKKAGGMFGFGGGGAPVQAHLEKKEYVDAIKSGVDALAQNPYAVDILRGVAQVLEALNLPEPELRLLKMALDAAPRDAAVNRHCALTLARVGQLDQAISCWHRIESINRGDAEASRAISNLTVQKARVAAGLGRDDIPRAGAMSAKPAPAVAAPAAEKKREIKLTRRQELERMIEDRPAETSNYCELADILIAEGKAIDAIRILSRALEASGNDLTIRERLEDAQLERARVQCGLAEKRAAVDKGEDAVELAKKLRSDFQRMELDLIFARSQRYPERKDLQFQLAQRLKSNGNYSEAVKYLDQIVGDEAWTGPATLEMGECYQHLQQYEKAWGCYKMAIQLLFDPAAPKDAATVERRKQALYRGGMLAYGLKKYDRAQQFFEKLLKLDPNYKDARARLDKVRQMRHKG